MRQHSALNRGIMFEWLQDLDDTGDRCPSDDAIMERFDFDTPEQARTLLADLADRGLISIRVADGERVVTIGRAGHQPARAERPVPSVVKDDPAVTRAAARIAEIVRRPKADPVPDKAASKGHQVNFKVSAEHYDRLRSIADAEDTFIGVAAKRFFDAGIAAAEPIHKPLIRAHVIRAARDAFRLDQMEEAKRDDWLRSFNGLLKTLNIFMPVDLADIAEGKGAAGENVVPMGQRAAPKLATIPMSDGKDDDLAGVDPEQQAAE